MLEESEGAERLKVAERHYRHCLLCEHRCGVDRSAGERGFCQATSEARVYRHRVECGEEIELIPSQLLYLSGCNLRCAFCIGEADAFDPGRGELLTPQFLGKVIALGHQNGVRTLQWVGGEPTIHLPTIIATIGGRADLPLIVWKSNFFGTIEAFELLHDVVDVYVADFKFGNGACARQIAGAENYMQIVTRNMAWAASSGRLIIRHLLLPGHLDCCYRPIVDWLATNMPETPLRVMDGYLPCWKAECHADLAYPLPRGTKERALQMSKEKGLRVID